MANDAKDGADEFENRLRERRQASGLSQKRLAEMAGMTRQAVCAVEANQYSPATSVALQLARALRCRVEDLFSIKSGGDIVEGELLGPVPKLTRPVRAQLLQVGDRLRIRPMDGRGEMTSLTASADGLIISADSKTKRAKVKLLKAKDTVRQQVVIGGCDPAMFLLAEHLQEKHSTHLVTCLMGSTTALDALRRGELHAAGVHLADERSDKREFPYSRRVLGDLDCFVVTFAHWEEGLMVRQGNPKNIRGIADLARRTVRIVNREKGSGARRLLDRELVAAGLRLTHVKGREDEVFTHLDVAARVSAGLADTGVGVRAAAAVCGLDFIPLQRERYDLIIPKIYYDALPGLKTLLDVIVTKAFRDELEALGGYDTRESGRILTMPH
jgi:molybdate-binding protein/DNA-binding XRE family transcriptional regulator